MAEDNNNSILIVEDNRMDIVVLNRILSKDYTIYLAKNGQDAIEAANKYLPDIILLDVVMPNMDGYEVISVLKSSDNTKAIPVIFITGLSTNESEEQGLALGAVDYISKPFTPAIVKLRICNQIKILNYIHTIEQLGKTDQMTGMQNRSSFDERIRLEWERAARLKSPVSVLIIDIDHFKQYNDTFGHMQGDLAIKAAAKVFMESARRSTDFAARWGGEEFIVLLPDTDSGGATALAEQLRANIENTEIPALDGRATKLTISIGINTQIPKAASLTEDFIRKADNALYRAKKEGRNRICRHEQLGSQQQQILL